MTFNISRRLTQKQFHFISTVVRSLDKTLTRFYFGIIWSNLSWSGFNEGADKTHNTTNVINETAKTMLTFTFQKNLKPTVCAYFSFSSFILFQ